MKIITPDNTDEIRKEKLLETTKQARVLLKKYPRLMVVLMGAHGLIGEAFSDAPKELCDVGVIYKAPVQHGTLGPTGEQATSLGLRIETPVGANASTVNRVVLGTDYPRYSVNELCPQDMLVLLDLYNQLRKQGELQQVSEEIWDAAAPDDEKDG